MFENVPIPWGAGATKENSSVRLSGTQLHRTGSTATRLQRAGLWRWERDQTRHRGTGSDFGFANHYPAEPLLWTWAIQNSCLFFCCWAVVQDLRLVKLVIPVCLAAARARQDADPMIIGAQGHRSDFWSANHVLSLYFSPKDCGEVRPLPVTAYTASSLSQQRKASDGRLKASNAEQSQAAWCAGPEDSSSYLQINLGNYWTDIRAKE